MREEIYVRVFDSEIPNADYYDGNFTVHKEHSLLKTSRVIEAEAYRILVRMTKFQLNPRLYVQDLQRLLTGNLPWNLVQDIEIVATIDPYKNPRSGRRKPPVFYWQQIIEKFGACKAKRGSCRLLLRDWGPHQDTQAEIMRLLKKTENLFGFRRVIIEIDCLPEIWAKPEFSLALLDDPFVTLPPKPADLCNDEILGALRHLETTLGSPTTFHLRSDPILGRDGIATGIFSEAYPQLEFHPTGKREVPSVT